MDYGLEPLGALLAKLAWVQGAEGGFSQTWNAIASVGGNG